MYLISFLLLLTLDNTTTVKNTITTTKTKSVSTTKAPLDFHSILKFSGKYSRGRHLVLTYDDGPSFKTTPLLLQFLDKLGLKATFFINGRRLSGTSHIAVKNTDVLSEISKRGHYIGNHTFAHPIMSRLSAKQQRWQINKNEQVIQKISGYVTKLYRPPYGIITRYSTYFLSKHNYAIVMWNLDSEDPFQRHVSEIFNTVLVKINRYDHGIVLFHDTHNWSVKALPFLVRAIRMQDCELIERNEPIYEFVTIDEISPNSQGKFDEPTSEMLLKAQKRRNLLKKWCNTLR